MSPPSPSPPRIEWTAPGAGVLLSAHQREPFVVHVARGEAWVRFRGRTHRIPLEKASSRAAQGPPDGASPRAPMPGIVLRVGVAEGDLVPKGGLLVAIEAMKIEHEVRAAAEGRVERVHVRPGERVDAGALLVELQPAKATRRPSGRKAKP